MDDKELEKQTLNKLEEIVPGNNIKYKRQNVILNLEGKINELIHIFLWADTYLKRNITLHNIKEGKNTGIIVLVLQPEDLIEAFNKEKESKNKQELEGDD